jgi:inosose dehydratase
VNIRIANAPVSWGIMEVEGWSPPLAYSTFLDELAGAGYAGTELGPYGYLPADPRVLGEELRRRSLTLTSAFVPLKLKEPALDLAPARQVAELLRTLGAQYLVLSDALWPEREAAAGRVEEAGVRLGGQDWDVVARNVRTVCEMAAEQGLGCVFHHHVGSYIETPAEVRRLLEMTPIGLCLDTGHYVYGGGDPVEAVESLGKRVEYLHFKDVHPARLGTARRSKLDFLGGVRIGVFCELGTGSVRFPELLQALDRIGYDGWAVVEQDVEASGKGPRPAESARKSREYLRTTLGI